MSERIVRMVLKWWIRHYWGKRCDYTDPNCGACKAWLMYDWLMGDAFDGDSQPVQIGIFATSKIKWDGTKE